jgi:conjugal transfer pilus assembly protein TraB
MKVMLLGILVGTLGAASASAEVMPTEDKTVNRVFPAEPGFQTDSQYKRMYENMRGEVETLRKQAVSAHQTLRATGATPKATSVGFPVGKRATVVGKRRVVPARAKATATPPAASATEFVLAVRPIASPASVAQVFAVSNEAEAEADNTLTVLPAGSFVRARVVSGVEANTLEPFPILLHLEHAFTGPNKTKVDLSNCFVIAKARANLSTERVIMETDTLSCVRENGEHFKTAARGFTAGDDSTFGSTGTFISKQGQVLLAAVLANIAKNAGEAVALAQQSTTVLGVDKAASATNVTGSKAAFVGGKSMVDAAGTVAQWYLDYAKQLIPSIGIGSGQTVHVVMLDTIRVPTLGDEQ